MIFFQRIQRTITYKVIGGKNVNTRQIDRQNYNKNYRMSSNNPIPKTTLLIQDRSVYEKFSSEAKKSSLSTKEGHKSLNLMNTDLRNKQPKLLKIDYESPG
ncbi:hypothetical protein H8356DRAFT_1077773 [Neocallimastix lanati (nom. inval.)]|uniref:Uncharacterized protein n=1 Tax=Neocallimastix californiae TaxID=1754190 RepID=A0A1Y1ZLS7_9FUNG|nr:hypothetical protein H8356DRAFT_1077773 [Neocallimastix sp. JGI-2020a]ORY11186.1 hypothetical protein LY90DRAFT_518564 [Neocallimastix californiae]|eukprot:ORY11186.1 hypothetical protein LY90DRAFT_518564 [Neocallimastix californiae]